MFRLVVQRPCLNMYDNAYHLRAEVAESASFASFATGNLGGNLMPTRAAIDEARNIAHAKVWFSGL